MAKQLFGNLITYRGSNLATAKAKAVAGSGNLVFAEITEGADKGFYIFANGAEGHMVTLADFLTLKAQVTELERLNDMPMKKDAEGNDTDVRMTVAEYVESYLASKTTTEVKSADDASNDLLPTEKAVRTAIDKAVSTLGTVMEFVGVTTTDVTVEGAGADVVINGVSKTAEKGDVVVYGKEEYVWDGAAWHEIGQVKPDEAVTSLGDAKGDIALGTALKVDGQVLDVKLAAKQGNVTLDVTDGLKASVDAEDLEYSAKFTVENADGTTTEVDFSGDAAVKNVKEALDDLYHGTRVTSEAINDINARLDGHDGAIADINTAIEGINKTIEELDKVTVVDGDENDFVEVATDKAENDDVTYTVTAKLAEQPAREAGKAAVATGLATDAYVLDAIANALAWEVLAD